MLARITATVRFDIIADERTDSWRIDMKNGDLDVSHGGGDADCVITAKKRLFDGIASGKLNAMAALLRGELAVSGDPELMVAVQRLFPGPPRMGRAEMSAACAASILGLGL